MGGVRFAKKEMCWWGEGSKGEGRAKGGGRKKGMGKKENRKKWVEAEIKKAPLFYIF
jgi:hypothetical protein